ncbi:MAG: retropepsin-like aspartic protease, partial [Chthoniobacterales bacterium]
MFNPKLAVAVLGPALFLSALIGPATAAPAAATRPPTVARALQFEALRLERSGQNRLLLRAFINGKPALLAVDSGAAVSVIASHRLRHFGLTPARSRVDIPARLSLNGAFNDVAIARTLQLGALNLLDEPMVVVDLAASPNVAERRDEEAIDGVIGADILFPTQAVLDCRAQVLILKMDPRVRGSAPGLDFSGLRRVKIHVTPGYTLYLDVRLNGRRARLMV